MTSPHSVPAPAPAANVCPRCGAAFVCGMANGGTQCWCASLPPLGPLVAGADCYCPACLAHLLAAQGARRDDAVGAGAAD